MKKAGVFYGVVLLLTLVFLSLGSTFAYFSATSMTGNENPVSTGSKLFSLSLAVNPLYPDPNNGPYTIIPMKDGLSLRAYDGYNNNPCIDKNNAVVCYIYEILVSDIDPDIKYLTGSLNITTSNISNLSYRVFDSEHFPLSLGTDEELNDIYINHITSGEDYGFGESFDVEGRNNLTLYLMIWLSDNGMAQNSTDIGTFSGDVTFSAGQGEGITGNISSAINGNYVG